MEKLTRMGYISRVIDSHEWENKMVIRLIHGEESLVGFQSDRGWWIL